MRPSMTKRQRKALGEYCRDVADKLGLSDWTIHLQHAACDDAYAAQIECTDGAHEAFISFNRQFVNHPPAAQRETVVHELLHAATQVTWRMVQNDLKGPLGYVGYSVFCDSYRRAWEYEVDRLAKAIAPSFPLIDWTRA